MISKTPPTLPIHEWLIVLLFCAILLILCGYAWLGRKTCPQIPSRFQSSELVVSTAQAPKVLHIKIEGEVSKPGTYELPLNSTLQEVLDLAKVLPTADLSDVKWRRKLRDGQTIRIPERRWITIEVLGAVVQPGARRVLSGTRVCELLEQIAMLPDADCKPLKKKRQYIQEGDRLVVPQKLGRVGSKKKKKFAESSQCR